MIVHRIALEAFRNYSAISADFSDHINVIIGKNAQGKTNLIESVYYLTTGRSFRSRSDRELIQFDKDSAYIRADICSGDREQKLEARITRGRRREFYANDVKLKKASDLSGRLTAVLFCPDDLFMIREGSAVRRKMMDSCLCQLRPRYAAVLTEFNRLYEHKTRILRDYHEKPSLLDTLDEFNDRLAHMSAELIYYRAAFAALLSEKASEIHREFSGGTERLLISYQTVKTIDDPRRKPVELLPLLLEHQQTHRRAEIESGLCLSGAHKDDLDIEINGISARNFASQGQARTAALSIKLAEREIHRNDRGEYPILLLDDVLSELDSGRQNFVLNRIGEGQVFITCCEDGQIASRTGGRVLRVENGEVFG
jgi:DNA replication and repair protein RecF